jgi:hypothetical protein
MKRLTKQQRRDAQFAALRQRVADIACGASGTPFDSEDDFATADFLSRFIPALKANFETKGRDYLWSPYNIDRFDRIDSTTQFLWEHGVRADMKPDKEGV